MLCMTYWPFIQNRSILGNMSVGPWCTVVKDPYLVFMGSFMFKWTHDPTLRRTARKKKRLQTSLDRFCDGDSPLFHRFSLFNTRAGHSGNRDLCCRLRLCNWRGYAPSKRVGRVLTHRKMVLSILNFSIWPHALTSHHRMDLNAIASFRDCELSIGLYRK